MSVARGMIALVVSAERPHGLAQTRHQLQPVAPATVCSMRALRDLLEAHPRGVGGRRPSISRTHVEDCA